MPNQSELESKKDGERSGESRAEVPLSPEQMREKVAQEMDRVATDADEARGHIENMGASLEAAASDAPDDAAAVQESRAIVGKAKELTEQAKLEAAKIVEGKGMGDGGSGAESSTEPADMETPSGMGSEMNMNAKGSGDSNPDSSESRPNTGDASTPEATEDAGIETVEDEESPLAMLERRIEAERARHAELAHAKDMALVKANAESDGRTIEEDEAVYAAIKAQDKMVDESAAELYSMEQTARRIGNGEEILVVDYSKVNSLEELTAEIDKKGGAYDAAQMHMYSPKAIKELIGKVRDGSVDARQLPYSDGLRETVKGLLAREQKAEATTEQNLAAASVDTAVKPATETVNEEVDASDKKADGPQANNDRSFQATPSVIPGRMRVHTGTGWKTVSDDEYRRMNTPGEKSDTANGAEGQESMRETGKVTVEFDESENDPEVRTVEAIESDMVAISARPKDKDWEPASLSELTAEGQRVNAERQEKDEWEGKIAAAKARDSKPPEAPVVAKEVVAPTEGSADRLSAARERVIDLESRLKKYDAVGAAFMRTASADARLAQADLQAKLESAKQEYGEARAKHVGGEVARMLAERTKLVDAKIESFEKDKGWPGKAYDAYKKLGEKNLTTVFGWEPQGSVMKRVAKAANLRTAASLALLGVGVVAGAGSAVGITALLGRRVLSGAGAGIGTYDLMRRSGERAAAAPDKAAIAKMNSDELYDRLGRLEASALMEGRSPSSDPGYEDLREAVLLRHEEGANSPEAGERTKSMEALLAQEDSRIDALVQKAKTDDRRRAIIAGTFGALVGGGVLAKAFGNVTSFAADTDTGKATVSGFRWAKDRAVGALSASDASEVAKARAAVDALNAPEAVRAVGGGWSDAPPPGMEAPAAPTTQGEVSFTDQESGKIVAEKGALAEPVTEAPKMDAAKIAKRARKAVGSLAATAEAAPKPKAIADIINEIKAEDAARFGKDVPGIDYKTASIADILADVTKDSGIPPTEQLAPSAQALEDAQQQGQEAGILADATKDSGVPPTEQLTPSAQALEDARQQVREIGARMGADAAPTATSVDVATGPVEKVSFSGGSIKFDHGASGEVTGYSFSGGGGFVSDAQAEEVLRKDWIKVAEAGKNGAEAALSNERFTNDINTLRDFTAAEKALTSMGKGAGPEAQYLREQMIDTMKDFEKQYGKIVSDDFARDLISRTAEGREALKALKEAPVSVPETAPAPSPVVEQTVRTKFEAFQDTPVVRDASGGTAGYDLSRGFRTEGGTEASFKYAQDGRIMAFEQRKMPSFETAAKGLNSDWQKAIEKNAPTASSETRTSAPIIRDLLKVESSTDAPLAERERQGFMEEFRADVRQVGSYEQGLKTLESDPLTRDSSEAQFLRAKIAAEKSAINSRYGEVYKSGGVGDTAVKPASKPFPGILGRIGRAFKNLRYGIGRGPRSIPPPSRDILGGQVRPK